jgi:8-oxo-dGTP pyrophosphatase MutT (NUDIX family)
MAGSNRYPSAEISSGDFVIGAGCILFRKSHTTGKLQICLLYSPARDGKTDKWLLPKGRKDMGESIEATALRETFEETGYPCELIPVRMPTRAPAPGTDVKDVVRVMDDATEPVAVTLRNLDLEGCKFTWWFIARVKENGSEKVEGTQAESEDYVSGFFDADEAVEKVTYDRDRHALKEALGVVRDNIKLRGMDVVFP